MGNAISALRKPIVDELNLSMISPMLERQARQAFDNGDAIGFVCSCPNHNALTLVYDNLKPLRRKGIYEEALVSAFTSTRTNHNRWNENELAFLFRCADREKMRNAGSPIPSEPVILYRGISGHGRARRILGWSWTNSLEIACWFAVRFNLAHPAVLTATVAGGEVLCCVNDRDESEFICRPTSLKQLNLTLPAMKSLAEQWQLLRKG